MEIFKAKKYILMMKLLYHWAGFPCFERNNGVHLSLDTEINNAIFWLLPNANSIFFLGIGNNQFYRYNTGETKTGWGIMVGG